MNDHIDQIAQWYADAEQITETNLPRSGDTLIFPYNAGGYALEVEEDNWTPDDIVSGDGARILSRAPKPKPAWHDAVAVLARSASEADRPKRAVWTWDAAMERWYDEGGCHWANTDDLRDVTPLIEAKVTDETQDRVWRAIQKYTGEEERYRPDYAKEIDAYARAALGLDSA